MDEHLVQTNEFLPNDIISFSGEIVSLEVTTENHLDCDHIDLVVIKYHDGTVREGVLKKFGTPTNYEGDSHYVEIEGYKYAMRNNIKTPRLLAEGTLNSGEQSIITSLLGDAIRFYELCYLDDPGMDEFIQVLNKGIRFIAEINIKGILHQDTDPKNILVTAADEIYIIDLAMCKIVTKGSVFLSDINTFATYLRLKVFSNSYLSIPEAYQRERLLISNFMEELSKQGVTIILPETT